MNKTLLISLLLFFVLASCQKREKILLPAKKVYIMATHFYLPDYESEGVDFEWYDYLKTVGVVEVSQNMGTKITRDIDRYFSSSKYLSADILLSDSIKKSLVKLVEECQQDTIFKAKEEIAEIYDGPLFIIVIEKENGEHSFVYPERRSVCPEYVDVVMSVLRIFKEMELKNITYLEYEEARKILDEKTKVFPKSLVQESGIFPPPPPLLRSTVKFVPPVILPDEEE